MAPPMLVLDEPTSDLDPVGTDEVLAVLRRLSRHGGRGIVLVEHKLDELAPYVDRVLLVDGGTIVIDDHPSRAFVPTSRWRQAGVRPPELVAAGEALPELFGANVPLSVDAAVRGLSAVDLAALEVASPGGAGSGASPALEATGVVVSFKGRRVLGPTSVRIDEGEWVALIGANGSGKTTLGAVLMGFVKPDQGTATCYGRPVAFGRIPQQAQHVGYLFQNVDDMLFSATVTDELTFTQRQGVPTGRDAPEPRAIAAMIGLADRLDAHPYELSGGERQRLGLGALLTRAPKALVLDEPTTGLDDVHATRLFDLLARVRTSLGSLTCLLITHDMRLVARFADRVVALRGGEIVLDTTPRRAFAEYELLETCGVRPPPVSIVHRRLAGAVPQVAVHAEELVTLVHASAAADTRERVVAP
jgi:energy-coupling factor transport system ATP-binding protein